MTQADLGPMGAHAWRVTWRDWRIALLAVCEVCGALFSAARKGVWFVYPHPEGSRGSVTAPPCDPFGKLHLVREERAKKTSGVVVSVRPPSTPLPGGRPEEVPGTLTLPGVS